MATESPPRKRKATSHPEPEPDYKALWEAVQKLYSINAQLVEKFTQVDRKACVKWALDEHIADKELKSYGHFIRRFDQAGGDEQYEEEVGASEDFGSQGSLLYDAYRLALELSKNEKALPPQPDDASSGDDEE
jgi:hypothetical protein